MMLSTTSGRVPFFLALLLAVTLLPAAQAGAQTAAALETPPEQGSLSANVYLQTSAEYRACCLGIYAGATLRLEEMLEDADPSPTSPAVVMDIDETVLDNSTFQTFLYVNGLDYSDELWERFEREGVGEVGLVPGAKGFIERAESLGVTVIYLSNRNESNLEWTAQALERVGLGSEGLRERLYLRPAGASSDKSPRRDEVAARYNVLMYFGDNLRDFSEVFAAPRLSSDASEQDYLDAIGARADEVDAASCHWGVDWFALPNPIYGEWEKLEGKRPADVLRPSEMAP